MTECILYPARSPVIVAFVVPDAAGVSVQFVWIVFMRLLDLPVSNIEEVPLGGSVALHAAPQGEAHGTPLLLIHGAFTHGWCWIHFLPWLAARGFDTWAIHLPGHEPGQSGSALNNASLDDYARAVIRAANDLPEPPVLVGHSMGAVVARLAAAKAATAGLALLSPVPSAGTAASAMRLASNHPMYLPAATAFNWSLPVSGDWQREIGSVLFGDMPTELPESAHQQLFQHESFVALQELWWLGWRRLPALPVPCAVIGGTADAMFPADSFEHTARELGANLILLKDQPHAWMLSQDWRRGAETLAGWLGAGRQSLSV